MSQARPRVGVVMTLLELYRQVRPEWPRAAEAQWRPVVEGAFAGKVDLTFTGVSHTPDEVAQAVRACEEADCDLLLVLPLAYAPSGVSVAALCETDLPLLLVSSARDATLPHDMKGDHIMANHAVHGIQDLANVLSRNGREFELAVGHFSDARLRGRLLSAARAAAGAHVFRRGRVGRMGAPFKGMLDFEPGPDFAETFGVAVEELDPAELAEAARSVAAGRVSDLIVWAKKKFTVAADMTAEEFETSARWSLAFEDMVTAHELDAITMNFLELADAGAGTMPFLGAGRLMGRGIGYAGESDVLTAALTASFAQMAEQATFTEMFCPDYARNEILLSHMGECNFALADPSRPVKLVAKPFIFGKCARPAVPVFQLKPGEVTLACLTQWPAEGYRLVVCKGNVVAAPDNPGMDSPYSRIRFGADLAAFLERYSRTGGTHHLAMAYGDLTAELAAFARFLSIHCEKVEQESA